MAIGTNRGATPWSSQEVADYCDVALTAATRKLQAFERRVLLVIEALRALEPDVRADRLAEMVTSVIETGGRLAVGNRQVFRVYLRGLIEDEGPGETHPRRP